MTHQAIMAGHGYWDVSRGYPTFVRVRGADTPVTDVEEIPRAKGCNRRGTLTDGRSVIFDSRAVIDMCYCQRTICGGGSDCPEVTR